jgi:hypothetical protein
VTQNGEGIRVPAVVAPGGTMIVNVGPNDATVEVSVAGSNQTTSHTVPANKDVAIPVPPVPGGTVLFVTVGKGLRARTIEVLVVSLAN